MNIKKNLGVDKKNHTLKMSGTVEPFFNSR